MTFFFFFIISSLLLSQSLYFVILYVGKYLSLALSLSIPCTTLYYILFFINHKAIDYKIISSPLTSYYLFSSAKKVLYPSASSPFITLISRNGPSRATPHHHAPFSLSLSHLSTSKRTTLFHVSIHNKRQCLLDFSSPLLGKNKLICMKTISLYLLSPLEPVQKAKNYCLFCIVVNHLQSLSQVLIKTKINQEIIERRKTIAL